MPAVPPAHPTDRPDRPTRRLPRRAWEGVPTALLITALFHLALIEIIPASGILDAPPRALVPIRPRPVELAPAAAPPVPAHLLPPAMRPAPPKFVEVNPLAPEAKPDHQRATGAADQRAAQPVPEQTKTGDRPRIQGEHTESGRIVKAIPREFLPRELRPAPGQPVGKAAELAAKPAKPRAASPEPKAIPGPSANAAAGVAFSPKPTESPKPADPAKAKPDPGPEIAVDAPEGDPRERAPRPRPKASIAGTTGPLGTSLVGSNEKGVVAVDSNFSRMGEYASRLLELIQANWWASIERSRVHDTGVVVIEYTLHRDGTITGATIASSTTSERAALICLDAITGRAPYDPWPEDMVAMLGSSNRCRLTFHYR